MLKALLIDIGGVILNEDELYRAYFKFVRTRLRESGNDFTDIEFEKAVNECILNFEPYFTKALVCHFIESGEKKCDDVIRAANNYVKNWALKHHQEMNPGILEVLQILSKKYTLALAANQPSAVKNLLKKYRILDHFAFTDVSEDIGIAKPDPGFFYHILNKLKVMPGEAVMVGDRLDNDIIPAKKLGMMTILVKLGTYAVLEPRSDGEIPDAIISDVRELPRAVVRLGRYKTRPIR